MLALGVVSFAIVAILGVLPVGLQTGHSAQDESRAAQVAQAALSGIAGQAQTQFTNINLLLNDTSTLPPLDLSQPQTRTLYADNDGKLTQSASGAVYLITLTTNPSPTGFDPGYANQVTATIAWPASAAPSNQTKRDFVRIISKY